ncbi:LysR substrate-binding domain-containing protein [Actinokineospora soli]|uniref:Probable hydrogen peroxide-inducible genes activator n=1 Tax=Actinokineospora soli TaxID=1048753 RepID=A0ABW2TG90_9PSEU
MGISTGGPTVAQLRAFLAVAEYLHFRKAAAALGVSQPTLSAGLSGCEEALGARLVDRTTRKVVLTRAGERLRPHAQAVLDAVDVLVAESSWTRGPFSGTVRLGVIPTVAPYLLPVALRALSSAYPELTVEVHEERTANLLESLESGRLDLGVLALPVGTPGLAVDPLYDEDFVLVTPRGHDLSTRDVVGVGVLRDLDVLLLEEGHCLRDQTLDICAEAGSGGGRAAGLTTLAQLVAAGMGVTVLPETALAVEAKRAGLAAVRFAPPAPRRRIAVAYRESASRAAEYAALAAEIRRAARARRLPVRILGCPTALAG